MTWTNEANPNIITLYNFETVLINLEYSKEPVEMPPFFKGNNFYDFVIDYNKKLGGIVPGQFMHVIYNSSQPFLTIENATGKQDKFLTLEDKISLSDYVIRNNLIDIALKNEECKWANCDNFTFIVREGNTSKTIKYTDQSYKLLNQIENVGNIIRTIK